MRRGVDAWCAWMSWRGRRDDDDETRQGVVAAQVVAGVGHVRGRHGDAVVHGERG